MACAERGGVIWVVQAYVRRSENVQRKLWRVQKVGVWFKCACASWGRG